MTSVIVAFLGAFGGVLAGLLPSLLISQRRRLLRLMEEESKLLDVVTDEVAKGQLVKALRATSRAYVKVATQRPLEQVRKRMIFVAFPAYVTAALAILVNRRADRLADTARGETFVFFGSLGMAAVAALVALFSLATSYYALLDHRRESAALREARARNRRLRVRGQKLEDSVDAALSEYEAKLPDRTSGETVDLVESLRRSVQAAKESRESEKEREEQRAFSAWLKARSDAHMTPERKKRAEAHREKLWQEFKAERANEQRELF